MTSGFLRGHRSPDAGDPGARYIALQPVRAEDRVKIGIARALAVTQRDGSDAGPAERACIPRRSCKSLRAIGELLQQAFQTIHWGKPSPMAISPADRARKAPAGMHGDAHRRGRQRVRLCRSGTCHSCVLARGRRRPPRLSNLDATSLPDWMSALVHEWTSCCDCLVRLISQQLGPL